MRSRYSAYTLADIDYIRATMQGKAAEGFDPTAAKQWAQSCEWLGLQVLKTETDGSNGTVELVATFKQNGQLQTMHERSKFLNVLGKWFYIDAYPGWRVSVTM